MALPEDTDWMRRALAAETKLSEARSRIAVQDQKHADAFEAGAKTGRNDAFGTVAGSLVRHAERLESTGGVVESACARVLRRAAENVRHHIVPVYRDQPNEEAS